MGTVYAQSFEGYIVFENKIESKIPSVSDAQMLSQVGNRQKTIYASNGNYVTVFEGGALRAQYYTKEGNKLYNLQSANDTLFGMDASMNYDPVVGIEESEEISTVYNLPCEHVVLKSSQSKMTYYFNSSKYPMSDVLYKDHNFGNWNATLSKIKALPLKIVYETNAFILTSTAVEVKEMKVDPKMCEIPNGVPVVFKR